MTRLSRYNGDVFRLRDYQHGDFEELYRIDTDCFQPGIAYSRGELQSYVQRKQSFCIIAEAADAEPGGDGAGEPKRGSEGGGQAERAASPVSWWSSCTAKAMDTSSPSMCAAIFAVSGLVRC